MKKFLSTYLTDWSYWKFKIWLGFVLWGLAFGLTHNFQTTNSVLLGYVLFDPLAYYLANYKLKQTNAK